MSSQKGGNRRFERVDLRARVQLTSLDSERDPRTGVPTLWESDELCETLSLGGAFIRTVDPPAKGRRVVFARCAYIVHLERRAFRIAFHSPRFQRTSLRGESREEPYSRGQSSGELEL